MSGSCADEDPLALIMRRRVGRRRFLTQSTAAALGLAVAGCATSSPSASPSSKPVKAKVDGDLYFFNWSSYISPKLIKGFEKQYGITVHQVYFATEDEAIAKVAAKQPYDVAIIDSTQVPRLVQAGLLREIDHSQLKNWNDVLPFFQNPTYDPGAKHTAPYDVGPVGIAWRTDLVSDMTGSFEDLWRNAVKAKGHAFVLDDMIHTLGMALLHAGFSENSGEPSQLKAATDALLKLKPDLGGISSNDYTMDGGNAWITSAWSGDMYYYLQTAKKPDLVKWEICKEGQLFTADNICVPTAARHPGTGLLFMDWLLAPEHVAENTAFIGYPVPTHAGLAAYKQLTVKYPWLNVGEDLISKPSAWLQGPIGSRLQLWTQSWTAFKAG